MHWKGPFAVTGKLGIADYRIQLGKTIKTFHANLLKKYVKRDDTDTSEPTTTTKRDVIEVVGCAVVSEDEVECVTTSTEGFEYAEDTKLPVVKAKESSSDVLINSELLPEQIRQAKRLVGNYKGLLTDLPGQPNIITGHQGNLRAASKIQTLSTTTCSP